MKHKFKIIIMSFLFVITFFSTVSAGELINTSAFPIMSMTKVGKNIYIQPDYVEKSDVICIKGNVYVNGTVEGDVIVLGGKVYLNGTVNGNVVTVGGSVIKEQGAKVGGKIYETGKAINIPAFKSKDIKESNKKSSFGVGAVIRFLVLSAFCYVIYELMSKKQVKMALSLERNLSKSFLYGYIAILAVPIIIIVLIFTIVGILLIPFLLIALGVIYLIGFTAIVMYMGRSLSIAFNRDFTQFQSILLGVALYEIIRVIPFIGSAASVFVFIPLGIGIALSTKFGSERPWRKGIYSDKFEDLGFDYKQEWNNFKKDKQSVNK